MEIRLKLKKSIFSPDEFTSVTKSIQLYWLGNRAKKKLVFLPEKFLAHEAI